MANGFNSKIKMVWIVPQRLETEWEMQIPGAGLSIQRIQHKTINTNFLRGAFHLCHGTQKTKFAETLSLSRPVYREATQQHNPNIPRR